jgi:tRNA threonylcarbamoyladenosine biosynthesis protein TsaB
MSRLLLFINTSDFHKLELALISGEKIYKLEKDLEFNENFKTLELLEKFLAKHKLKLKDVGNIIVCSGPGSFTGIRVGVSLAQALGFGLNIPVVAIPKSKLPKDLRKLSTIKLASKLTLHYGAKPKITKSKK